MAAGMASRNVVGGPASAGLLCLQSKLWAAPSEPTTPLAGRLAAHADDLRFQGLDATASKLAFCGRVTPISGLFHSSHLSEYEKSCSDIYFCEGGVMPVLRTISAIAGELRNLSNAAPASGCSAPVATPAT